jgi:glyoxylate utilization-related uncharacterized protein
VLIPSYCLQGGGGPRHEVYHRQDENLAFQRFILVLTGSVDIVRPGLATITLKPNHYAFFPADSEYRLIASDGGAGVLVYERLVDDLELPEQQLMYGEVEKTPLLDTGVRQTLCTLSSTARLQHSITMAVAENNCTSTVWTSSMHLMYQVRIFSCSSMGEGTPQKNRNQSAVTMDIMTDSCIGTTVTQSTIHRFKSTFY